MARPAPRTPCAQRPLQTRVRDRERRGPYFLFVGEDGSALGGMQDYYGSYRTPGAARRAVPEGVHWAELATVRRGRLEVIGSGRRHAGAWRWDGGGDTEKGPTPEQEEGS